jgi:hypothetical protein
MISGCSKVEGLFALLCINALDNYRKRACPRDHRVGYSSLETKSRNTHSTCAQCHDSADQACHSDSFV